MAGERNAQGSTLKAVYEALKGSPELETSSARKKMEGAIQALSKRLRRPPRTGDLNAETLASLSRWLERRKAAPSYVNLVSYQLRKLARLATGAGYSVEVPAVVRRRETDPRGMSAETFLKLLAVVSHSPRRESGVSAAVWWKAFLLVMVDARLRPGELLALTSTAWNGDECTLTLADGCRQKLHRSSNEALQTSREGTTAEALFPWSRDPSGAPFHALRNHFRELCYLAGIPSPGSNFEAVRRMGRTGAREGIFRRLHAGELAQMAERCHWPSERRRRLEPAVSLDVFHDRACGTSRIATERKLSLQVCRPEPGRKERQHIVTISCASPRSLRRFFLEIYLPLRMIEASPRGQARYLDTINVLRDFAGCDVTLDGLSEELLAQFAAKCLKQGKARATVAVHIRNLCVLWRFAYRKRLIDRELRDPPVVRQAKVLPIAWSMDELNRILSAAREAPGKVGRLRADLFWPAFVLALYDTGLRVSALLSCRCDQLDLMTGELRVHADQQKQLADQVFTLCPDTLDAVKATHPETRRVLFPFRGWRRTFHGPFREILRRAGLPATRRDLFHKIRRTSASHLASVAGKAVASKHLGHSSPQVTERYLDPRICDPGTRRADLLPRPSFAPRTAWQAEAGQ